MSVSEKNHLCFLGGPTRTVSIGLNVVRTEIGQPTGMTTVPGANTGANETAHEPIFSVSIPDDFRENFVQESFGLKIDSANSCPGEKF